ncbi:MAG: hypothetical protein IT259_00920 [Saprospiraceae bacterium]|nr:hypothetical protein [Saprospiraceae bacterium]
MSRLISLVQDLKARIGEGIEPALKFLEQILSPGSDNYNDFIQIKGRYNSLQRELLLGTLDPVTYEKARNGISQSLLLLADTLQEDDLKPEAGQPAPAADKRGEIIYRIPDRMQHQHEEKCIVRLAWVLEHLLKDWEKTAVAVVKNIRMAEIMVVYLLNVDERNPFAIRTVSEPVQFVDKDDYTEWVFYLKPLLIGSFPLVLRVSVIEMINGREIKKDIVLEEQIIVVSEEVPPTESFKKAEETLVVGESGASADMAKAAETEGPNQAKKKSKWLGIALSTVALALVGVFFGVPYVQETQAWRKARQGGQQSDYEDFLARFPDGRFREAAIDSLQQFHTAAPDTLSTTVGPDEPLPVDTNTVQIAPDTPSATPAPGQPAAPKPKPKPVQPKPSKPQKTTQGNTSNTDQPVGPPKPSVVVPPSGGIPALSGKVDAFDMRPFSIFRSAGNEFQIKFLEFNDKGQSLVTLAARSEWTIRRDQELVFVLGNDQLVRARLAYVAESEQGWRNGYFILEKNDLKKLADGRVNSIRLQDFKPPAIKGFTLSDGNRRDLRQRAERAMKKLD